MPQNYRLTDPAARIPMPDSGNQLFPSTPEGRAVDPANPFIARLIREKAIEKVPAKPRAKSSKPAAAPDSETQKG